MTEQEMIKLWVKTWKEFGPELERIRLREVREEDPTLSLQQLARVFNQATRSQPPDASSGMIEMQRVFAKVSR